MILNAPRRGDVMGRKSKYDECVKPNLEKIRAWRKTGGTVEQICDVCGVSVATFFEYLKKYPELQESYKKGTTEFVCELKGQLAYLTTKHTLETTKVYRKKDEITGNETTYQEKTIKEVDPDIAAINLLLKNLDKKNWSNDPALLDIKKQTLELQKLTAEAKEW